MKVVIAHLRVANFDIVKGFWCGVCGVTVFFLFVEVKCSLAQLLPAECLAQCVLLSASGLGCILVV